MLKVIHTVPSVSDTERPVPRWALRTAYLIPVMLLPWCLWRLPFAFGFEMGQVPDHAPGSMWVGIPYVFGLSVLSEAAALACLGLVRGWGEVAPGRLPIVGGKRIPPSAAVIPAALGGLILTVVTVDGLLTWMGIFHEVAYTNHWWQALATACTAPGVLWGPAVLALTYAYYVRRCRPPATSAA